MSHKRCCSCSQQLPSSAFNRQSRSRDGLQAFCRPCQKDHKYRQRYGVSSLTVADMLSRQRGCCDVCEQPLEKFVVDHDHATGVVRSLLCNACNVGIGQFRDDPELLIKAAEYLKRMKR